MRLLAGAALFTCACQLLPRSDISCAESDRCPSVPDMAAPMDMASAPTTVTSPFVLGQPNAQTNWLQLGFGDVKGVSFLPGNKFAISDQDNNRVLIWNKIPTQNQQPPDVVIGQPDFSVGDDLFPSPKALRSPTRIAIDGEIVIIASDNGTTTSSQPLTFWNPIPTVNNPDYSLQINPGPNPIAGARTFLGASPAVVSSRLVVVDRQFSRVLIWNAVPTNNMTNAALVLGQANFTSTQANAGGVSASALNLPDGTPATDGTALYVPDTANHRVLMWDAFPTANAQAANRVLGQVNATSNTANRGGSISLATMDAPSGVASAGGRVVVADRYNHRVLLWNSPPTATGQAADSVLGQTSGTSGSANAGGVSASVMGEPLAVATDGTRVAVADTYNYRVLLWNSWPTANGVPADVVLGQPSFSTSETTGVVVSDTRLAGPAAVTRAGSRLLVLDGDASRVLIWPQLPLDGSAKPTVVLGQPSMLTMRDNVTGVSGNTLYQPRDMSSDGTTLAVADTQNHRVLIWTSIPTQTFQAATTALGQPNPNSNLVNAGGSAIGLNTPRGVCIYKNRLFVADTANNRVLIWNSIPLANQQLADVVLGQSNLTQVAVNRGLTALDATTLNGPRGIAVDDGHIYVGDEGNSRLLIWNTNRPTSGQAANVVLGANTFGTTGSYSALRGLHVAGTRLYAAEYDRNRVWVWNTIPTQNNQIPTSVLGQPSALSSAPNAGGIGPSGLQGPYGILDTEAGLYIADYANGRVVVQPPAK